MAQRVVGTHSPDEILSAHDRHSQGRDDERRYQFQGIVQRFTAVMGKAQLVVFLQVVGNKECHILVVIDDEYQGTLAFPSGTLDTLLGKTQGIG